MGRLLDAVGSYKMVKPHPTMPGQESVWAYPRPAIAEIFDGHVKIVHRGRILADTHKAVRTLETSHPPSYYFPRDDVDMSALQLSIRRSTCEWKGQASYFHLKNGAHTLHDVSWSYAAPTEAFLSLKNHIAFYAGPLDDCFVDGEKVAPQPGSFYGGWITSRVSGPFKGIPGSMFW
jgi:uncharacterized protein (DUF427 family)